MKWIPFLIAISLVLGCGSDNPITSTTPDPQGLDDLFWGTDSTLEVMTWNLENFPKDDNTTIAYAAQIIKNLDADIVALQEIISLADFSLLEASLPGWEGYRAGWASSDWQELAYLINTEHVTITQEPYEIFEDEWYAFPREPYIVHVAWQGQEVVIINNHLKAYGDPESQDRRLQACIMLKDYIDSQLSDMPVIVVGDMNDILTDAAADNVFQGFLDDDQNYLFADYDIASGSSYYWSYPFWQSGSHLDHILITNEFFDQLNTPPSQTATQLIDNYFPGGLNAYEQALSDHRPVAIKLTTP
jgi:endonuclease/exonuclease/phosphatase family metal-dependent hydrolase